MRSELGSLAVPRRVDQTGNERSLLCTRTSTSQNKPAGRFRLIGLIIGTYLEVDETNTTHTTRGAQNLFFLNQVYLIDIIHTPPL